MRKMYSENQIKKMSGEVASLNLQETIDKGDLSSLNRKEVQFVYDDEDAQLTLPEELPLFMKKYRLLYLELYDENTDIVEFRGLIYSDIKGVNFTGSGYETNNSTPVSAIIEDDILYLFNTAGSSVIFHEHTYTITISAII